MLKHVKIVLLLSFLCMGPAAWANSYSDAIKVFSNAGESGQYFKTAYGYALFPTIGKAGIVVGGAYGEGKVFAGSKHVGNSTVTQLTLGVQLGGQAISQIIFFENEQAFRDFTSGNFEITFRTSIFNGFTVVIQEIDRFNDQYNDRYSTNAVTLPLEEAIGIQDNLSKANELIKFLDAQVSL